MRDNRTPTDVCGEANIKEDKGCISRNVLVRYDIRSNILFIKIR